MSFIDPQREQVHFHIDRHVAQPCFYSCLEWTNKTLPLKVFLHISHVLGPLEVLLQDLKETWSRRIESQLQCVTLPLDATESFTLDLKLIVITT